MGLWIDSSGPKLVRSALLTQRVNSSQVAGAIAHFKDDPGALSPFLDEEVFDRLVPQSMAEERTLECFSVASYGVGFVAFTALKPAGAGEPPLRSVELTRSPVTREPLSRLPRRSRLRPGSVVTELRATRPSRLGVTDRAITELLVELPVGGAGGTDGAGAVGSSGLRQAATRIAEWVWEERHALTFVHWPAAPPAVTGAWRTSEGPCVRFAVATPGQDVAARLAFGRVLLERCAELGYGLWIRQTGEPTGPHDYWRCLFSPDQAAGGRPASGWRAPPADRLAVTCVGPAHRGTTAAIMRILDEGDVGVPALSVATLDDLSVVHIVADDRGGDTGPLPPDGAEEPGPVALRRLFGLGRGARSGAGRAADDPRLDDYRVMATRYPAREQPPSGRGTRSGSASGPVSGSDKPALWLAWSTPAVHGALSLIVNSARAALTGALEAHGAGDTAKPSIEYLISRAVSVDRLRGRAKVSLDLDAVLPPAAAAGRTDWTGRLCSEIERRWRADLSFTLGTPRVDLEVVWRESWLGRWSVLQRGDLR